MPRLGQDEDCERPTAAGSCFSAGGSLNAVPNATRTQMEPTAGPRGLGPSGQRDAAPPARARATTQPAIRAEMASPVGLVPQMRRELSSTPGSSTDAAPASDCRQAVVQIARKLVRV